MTSFEEYIFSSELIQNGSLSKTKPLWLTVNEGEIIISLSKQMSRAFKQASRDDFAKITVFISPD
ncbi:MAG: hypothetical protein DWQ49_15670 [Bacteroidetes bacterium]|nr:MAG: hypothetical protein DWQ49_15670 [Bacteroidota bacterium]